MLIGLDQERRIKIVNTHNRVSAAFKGSRAQMKASFDALNFVLSSSTEVNDGILRRGWGALVLVTAFEHSQSTTSSLIKSAEDLQNNPGISEEIFDLAAYRIGDRTKNNPTYMAHTDQWNLRIARGVLMGASWLLKEIEEGDEGLDQFMRLPSSSIKCIAKEYLKAEDQSIYLFPTAIPGLKLGLSPNGEYSSPYLVTEQLNSLSLYRN